MVPYLDVEVLGWFLGVCAPVPKNQAIAYLPHGVAPLSGSGFPCTLGKTPWWAESGCPHPHSGDLGICPVMWPGGIKVAN